MIEKIIDLISKKPYSVSELSRELQIENRRVIIEYLRKIEKIAKRKGWKFEIIPARCNKCGYTFKKEIKVPSQCPRCKSNWISEPKFYIKVK